MNVPIPTEPAPMLDHAAVTDWKPPDSGPFSIESSHLKTGVHPAANHHPTFVSELVLQVAL
jgi:hypothetical protein